MTGMKVVQQHKIFQDSIRTSSFDSEQKKSEKFITRYLCLVQVSDRYKDIDEEKLEKLAELYAKVVFAESRDDL